ncbi:acyl-CoA desaturase [Actinocorallia longicatena]|uniref:Acyl-CoA desaturase n=1 Tax=Actinocorallia longicatena TaxID=111803 RepID=A0ABP6Q582_9ACTN
MTAAPIADAPRRPADDYSDDRNGLSHKILVALFTGVPFLALLAAVPFAWGWALGWSDIVIGAIFYFLSAGGITVGFHRYFTHGSFKANRPLRIALALCGSLAIEGPVMHWVADHRRHHKFSDTEGDPHSPWKYGDDAKALFKGLIWSHYGWLYASKATNVDKYAKDLKADPDMQRIHSSFGAIVAATFLLPAAIGGLVTMSWAGFFTALFWAGFVRVTLVQHVTWSINSICHTFGNTPFASRDQARNVWWLAIPSLGESWHNLHHADPTAARHGVLKGQIDISARVIWIFEKLGWAKDVRWPSEERLAAKKMVSSDAQA